MTDAAGPAELFVGCPMWANRDWVGRGLPADTPRGGELAAYAQRCNAVEGNTTFYGVPTPRTVARWAEQVPERFRFVFKVPRMITHERRLAGGLAELREFCERVAVLGPRLGPTSVQLPASFGPSALAILDRFLAELPKDRPWAVEVRHPAFSAGRWEERALNDLLHARAVDRVLLDTRALFAPEHPSPADVAARGQKPRLPVRPVAIGPHPVVRFVGSTNAGANPSFWRPWTSKVSHWLEQGRSPFVFVHTSDNVAALAQALAFRAEVQVPERSSAGPPALGRRSRSSAS